MYVKVCGATSIEDALLCVDCGADALGLNLIPSSKRHIDEVTASKIVRAVDGQVPCIGVVAGYTLQELIDLESRLGLDALQLHGGEPGSWLASLSAGSYLAARIRDERDVLEARSTPGKLLLTDARVKGALGGTGQAFDWTLVVELAAARPLILAGGLHPDNVEEAVRRVNPHAVDVASGVELRDNPRRKDPTRVRDFIERAKQAARVTARSGFFGHP